MKSLALHSCILPVKGLLTQCAALAKRLLVALRVKEACLPIMSVVLVTDCLATSCALEAAVVHGFALDSSERAFKKLLTHCAALPKGLLVAVRVVGPVLSLVCVVGALNGLLAACTPPAAAMPFAAQCSQP